MEFIHSNILYYLGYILFHCDWWIPTSAVHLIGCYFTTGGGALRIYISEDETGQIDVYLAHMNLQLHCSLQGQGWERIIG